MAGDACQYIAEDECERLAGGSVPNGAQFCVNGGTCALSSGTTYCECGDAFGGNQCETPKENDEDKNVVSKTPTDIDLALSLIHGQKAPTPAPTPAETIRDTEMDQNPIDGSEPDPADDPATFFNLDFPINKNKGETPKTESAVHHDGNKSKSNSKHTETETKTSQKGEGLSEPAQFGVFFVLAGFLSVLTVAIYRRRRMQKFDKEKTNSIHNANLHYVGDSSAADEGANGYRDEIYKNAIFDANGKVEAFEII